MMRRGGCNGTRRRAGATGWCTAYPRPAGTCCVAGSAGQLREGMGGSDGTLLTLHTFFSAPHTSMTSFTPRVCTRLNHSLVVCVCACACLSGPPRLAGWLPLPSSSLPCSWRSRARLRRCVLAGGAVAPRTCRVAGCDASLFGSVGRSEPHVCEGQDCEALGV